MGPSRRFEAAAALTVVALAAAVLAVVGLATPRPLGVVATSPADGAGGVPPGAQVTFTFSRPVDEASAREAVRITPATEGFVSAAGRRLAFTPKAGLRPDTEYTVTVEGLRDRSGRALPAAVSLGFRTRGEALVARRGDGRLLLVALRDGEPVPPGRPVGGPDAGPFAVGPRGEVAYAVPGEAALVVRPPQGERATRVPVPAHLEVRELAWAAGGAALLLLASDDGGPGAPYIVRLGGPSPSIEPFGPRPDPIPTTSAMLTEALKKSLVEVVYKRETLAVAPDGRTAIIRDRSWDFAAFGLDGARRASFGAFLAVGDAAAHRGTVAFVDVDPADGLLRRQVLLFERTGRLLSVSAAARDNHSPSFAHRGDRVVFASGEAIGQPASRRYAIELLDLTRGARLRLTVPPEGASDEDPRWSPGDTWISFRRVPVGQPTRAEVWLVRADGGPARPLGIEATDARWAP